MRVSTAEADMDGSDERALLVGAGRGEPGSFTSKVGRAPDAAVFHPGQPVLDWLDRRLLEGYQRDFPICEKPFAEIANRLRCRTSEVLQRLATLERSGMVRRIGPVFAPELTGAATLAAMAVPQARLDSVAEWVNRCQAVGDTCLREHEFNLWFVLAAPHAGDLYETLTDIRRRTGLDVLDLRLERDYHVDPEFPPWPRSPSGCCPTTAGAYLPGRGPRLDAFDRCLVGAVRDGLSLTARPYAVLAKRTGLSEAQVMERLRCLLCEGVIKRIGLVVRHHQIGYRANAMVVFDVPRARVDMVGERLARVAPVTVCCRRTRRAPVWPYNLYCMLHGRDRAEVMSLVDDRLPDAVGNLDRAVLFGCGRLRRRVARYAPEHAFPRLERPAPRLHREL